MDDDHLGYILLIILVFCTSHLIDGLTEYCQFEPFNATCKSNEVIIMNEAKYGRLRSGGCLGDTSEESLNCFIDVLPLMDRLCSGQRSCEYEVGQEGLYKKRPCGIILHALEASYECVEVLPPKGSCSDKIITLTDKEGFITSQYATLTHCLGPLRIQAHTGQIIDITWMDFSENSMEKCVPRGWMSDIGLKNNITLCSNGQRQYHLYKSSGNIVEVHLFPRHNTDNEETSSEFIIHYKILGCMDLIPPPHGWYERAGEKAVIGCKHRKSKWHIKCVNNLWQGVVGKCYKEDNGQEKLNDPKRVEQQKLIFLLVIILLGMVLLVSILGTICIIIKYRRHHSMHCKNSTNQNKSQRQMHRQMIANGTPAATEETVTT